MAALRQFKVIAGEHIEGSRRYKQGDTVTSSTDLAKRFRGKFQDLGPVAPTPVPVPAAPPTPPKPAEASAPASDEKEKETTAPAAATAAGGAKAKSAKKKNAATKPEGADDSWTEEAGGSKAT